MPLWIGKMPVAGFATRANMKNEKRRRRISNRRWCIQFVVYAIAIQSEEVIHNWFVFFNWPSRCFISIHQWEFQFTECQLNRPQITADTAFSGEISSRDAAAPWMLGPFTIDATCEYRNKGHFDCRPLPIYRLPRLSTQLGAGHKITFAVSNYTRLSALR